MLCGGCQRDKVAHTTLTGSLHLWEPGSAGSTSPSGQEGPPFPEVPGHPGWAHQAEQAGGGGGAEAGTAAGQSVTVPPAPPPGSLFSSCHALVPPQYFYEACVFDSCFVPSAGLECASLQAYAALCAQEGACIAWRNHTHGACCECPLAPGPGGRPRALLGSVPSPHGGPGWALGQQRGLLVRLGGWEAGLLLASLSTWGQCCLPQDSMGGWGGLSLLGAHGPALLTLAPGCRLPHSGDVPASQGVPALWSC